MGFKQAKEKLIDCLEQGNFTHEERNHINIKNLLAIGEISTEEIINILKQVRGNEYENSPHHYNSNISVHIIKTVYKALDWYIKWYFDKLGSVFISVHH